MTSTTVTDGKVQSFYETGNDVLTEIDMLRELFPELTGSQNMLLAQMKEGKITPPSGIKGGLFAIPHWSKIAPTSNPTYQGAVEKVLDLLKTVYGGRFNNYYWDKSKFGPEYLRETSTKSKGMEVLQLSQNADILLVPVEFSISQHILTIQHGHVIMTDGRKFSLGLYEVGIILLTHSFLANKLDYQWMSCDGDEFSPDSDGNYRHTPFFGFYGGRVMVDSFWYHGTFLSSTNPIPGFVLPVVDASVQAGARSSDT